jgi:hypothetical protein
MTSSPTIAIDLPLAEGGNFSLNMKILSCIIEVAAMLSKGGEEIQTCSAIDAGAFLCYAHAADN